MDDILRHTWGQYRTWAATSRRIKKQVGRAGVLVLTLTLGGAVLGALGPFFVSDVPLLSWLAAAMLALATYFTTQLLSESSRAAWVKGRAVAEALKSESYKYLTRTEPYDTNEAPARLAAKTESLLQMTSSTLAEPLSASQRLARAPDTAWTLDDYIQRRVRDQIDTYYLPAIVRHRRLLRVARTVALVLGGLAVLLSASAAGPGSGTDAAMTLTGAVLGTVTTAAAATAAWFQSGNHLQNALIYQSTVTKLELLLAQTSRLGQRLVIEAEAIFQAEHAAWLAQWQTNGRSEAPGEARSTQQREQV